jgi:hypothetical protein
MASAPTGALLVRPDGLVAWRTTGAAADPAAELARILRAILRAQSERRPPHAGRGGGVAAVPPGAGGCAPQARKSSVPSKLARSPLPHAELVQVPEHRRVSMSAQRQGSAVTRPPRAAKEPQDPSLCTALWEAAQPARRQGIMNTRTADHAAVTAADRSKPPLAGPGRQLARSRVVLS